MNKLVAEKNLEKVVLTRSYLPVLRNQGFSSKRSKVCTVALDSFSEINIMSSLCASQLGLIGEPLNLQITGAGGVETVTKSKLVKISLIDRNNNVHEIEFYILIVNSVYILFL